MKKSMRYRLRQPHNQCFSESQSQNGENPCKQEAQVKLDDVEKKQYFQVELSNTFANLRTGDDKPIPECYNKFEEEVRGAAEKVLDMKRPKMLCQPGSRLQLNALSARGMRQ